MLAAGTPRASGPACPVAFCTSSVTRRPRRRRGATSSSSPSPSAGHSGTPARELPRAPASGASASTATSRPSTRPSASRDLRAGDRLGPGDRVRRALVAVAGEHVRGHRRDVADVDPGDRRVAGRRRQHAALLHRAGLAEQVLHERRRARGRSWRRPLARRPRPPRGAPARSAPGRAGRVDAGGGELDDVRAAARAPAPRATSASSCVGQARARRGLSRKTRSTPASAACERRRVLVAADGDLDVVAAQVVAARAGADQRAGGHAGRGQAG